MVMVIKALVDRADYENISRSYWLREDIEASLEVDGIFYRWAGLAYRDGASLNYPKKGFVLTFANQNLFRGHTRRLDLSASYGDKSLIRQRLSFDLCRWSQLPAPTAWHVDFSIIDAAGTVLEQGLFTAIEPVDRCYFRNRQREIGTLYRATGGLVNGVFTGATLVPQPEPLLRLLYKKESSKKIVARGMAAGLLQRIFQWPRLEIADNDPEDYSDLAGLINTIASRDAASLSPHLAQVMDVDAYLDWLAVNTLLQSNDSYHKNYYLHHRVEDDRWEIIPRDYALSWGRIRHDYCGDLCDDLPADTSLKGRALMSNQLSRRVLNNRTYFEWFRIKLINLLDQTFTEDKLFPRIEAYYAEVEALAYQDIRKWPTNDQFDDERTRLEAWIRRRRAFLLKELGLHQASAKLPDTIVSAVGADRPAPVAGDQLVFEATVQNIGGASTGATVGVAFLVDGDYVTYGTSGPLEAGASRLIRAVAPWTATPGAHTLLAVVDDVNRYPEVLETNNTLQTNLYVGDQPPPSLSDVVVKDVAFERDAAGQVRLAALVTNQGAAPTDDLVGVAFLVDDRFATFGLIEALAAGQSGAVRATQPLALTGLRKITAIVDDVNRFPEQNEANNIHIEMIDFGPAPGHLADTVILGVSLGDGRFTEGDELFFEATVKNIGPAPSGDVVGVAFLVDGQYITFGTSAPLAPDETRRIRAVSPWRATAGRHRLLAIVDDVNRYPEISETNNRFEQSFEVFRPEEIRLPDSTVEAIDFENNDGSKIILTATVSNIGTMATPDVVGVAFFVDGQYTTFGTTAPMAPGTTETIRAVRPLALRGWHKITAIVDDVNRYDEISHQNNRLEREINFQPQRRVERRALWVTRYDWTQLGKAPPPEAIDALVDKVAGAGFNTIFFQVRGAGDAYYTPGLEPWAARLTGSIWATQGRDPGWDPLARLLEKAHLAGLEVHAYINVYSVWVAPPNQNYGQLEPPATTPPHMYDRLTYGPEDEDHPGEHRLGAAWRQHAAPGQPMALAWGEPLWASPGVDEVQDHTVAVVSDIVRRYALDGIHFDLIRYANRPYSFDPASNAAAGSEKTAARDQWQRERITSFVRRAREQAESIRPGLWLSAAVWPYYQNKWGWRVSTGYDDYYQDSKGWLTAGIADAIAPMMYGAVADELENWKILLADFLADSHGRHIYPGVSADYDDFAAIAQRIEAARTAGAPGHTIYSYRFLERHGYWTKLVAGPYAEPVRLPVRPRLTSP